MVEDDGPPLTPDVAPPEPPKKAERFTDPDTNETYDGRTRAARRIRALLAERQELRAQVAARAERTPESPRNTSLPAAGAPQAAADSGTDDPRPREEDYPNDWPKFIKDEAAWTARDEFRKLTAKQTTDREEKEFWDSYRNDQKSYRTRAEEYAKSHPDFREVANRVVASDVMQHACFNSERGPEIVEWLGKHPEDAKQIAKDTEAYGRVDMPFVRSMLERLASSPVAQEPAVRPVSKAPAPIKPLSGAATPDPTPKSPDDMDLREWQAAKKRRRSA